MLVAFALAILLSLSTTESTLDGCDVCRLVVDGFERGLKTTEQQNFQGGNTAWENKNLGKYAFSETRFIEIMEVTCAKMDSKAKLINEKIAKCHSMTEENEELFEEWFFRQRKTEPSLFAWLCVDRLRVCCPANHFGPDCEPCPPNARAPCFGNGRCLGAGKRSGSGKCKCKTGYQGKLCRQCAHNYYLASKNDTHVVCLACHQACQSGCNSSEPDGCFSCRSGWQQTDKGCADVDECLTSSPCSANMFEQCENTVGSYRCVCREAFRREDGVCIPDPDAKRPVLFGLRARDILRLAAYGGLSVACILIWLRPTGPLVFLLFCTFIVLIVIERGYVDRYIDLFIATGSDATKEL